MESQQDPVSQEQGDTAWRRNLRWIVFWVLLGFVLGFGIGYGVFMMRDYDAHERDYQHIEQYHSGRHQGV